MKPRVNGGVKMYSL